MNGYNFVKEETKTPKKTNRFGNLRLSLLKTGICKNHQLGSQCKHLLIATLIQLL